MKRHSRRIFAGSLEWFNALPESQGHHSAGGDLLSQPTNFRQQSDKQANLLKDQWSFVVGADQGVRYVAPVHPVLVNPWLIRRLMMKRIINVANGVVQQRRDVRIRQFLSVGAKGRDIAGERVVQTQQAEGCLTDFCRSARLS